MSVKTKRDYEKDYTKPSLRANLKEKIKEEGKGGEKGKWSARKSQLLKREYEAQGGDYKHKGKLSTSQKNLRKWGKETNKTRLYIGYI